MSSVSQQKVTNIDEVLEQHNQFLDNCMKDCLLTNSDLLRTVYKMMLICINFSNFLLRMTKSTSLDYLHMTKSSNSGSFDGETAQGGASSGLGDLVDYTKGTQRAARIFLSGESFRGIAALGQRDMGVIGDSSVAF